jgi:hypothetical protein
MSSDLLHQVIKGTFKDHFVAWICDYLILRYGQAAGEAIIDEIDRRYVLLSFPGLRAILNMLLCSVSLPRHLFLVCVGSPKAGTSSIGRAMTAKPL